MIDYLNRPWRQGQRVPQHVYVQAGTKPSEKLDVPMWTAPVSEVAAHICRLHNALVAAKLRPQATDWVEDCIAMVAEDAVPVPEAHNASRNQKVAQPKEAGAQ